MSGYPSGGSAADIVITIHGADGTGVSDEVRSLRSTLAGEDELAGRVRLVESPPASGQLGGLVEALQVVLMPGSAAAVAAAVVAWVRQRRSDVKLTARRGNGDEIEMEVSRLRGLHAAQLPAVTLALQHWVDHGGSLPPIPGPNGVGAPPERALDAAAQELPPEVAQEPVAGE